MGPDFIVLTGFLGSGKTTLLRDFLSLPDGADTAVIVNEAGEIGLDGAILRESGAGTPIAMLSNGCICCQVGSDLAHTVEALLAVERPDTNGPLRRIILETSGLSKPGPVLRQLASLAAPSYAGDRGRNLRRHARDEARFVRGSGARSGRRLTASSSPRPTPSRMPRWRGRGRRSRPSIRWRRSSRRRSRGEAVAAAFAPLAGLAAMPDLPRVAAPAAHPRIAVRLARPAGILGYDTLAAWLDNLAGALGERLLRLKGLVRVAESERPLLVQSVGTSFSPPRPFGAPNSDMPLFLVVIARDLEDAELDAVQPVGSFTYASWTEPATVARAGSLQSAMVEWM